MYYALWYGSNGYGVPDSTDFETFKSIKHALRVFHARMHSYHFPCVENPEMALFKDEPGDYPDYLIDTGPRGGVRIQRV